MIQFYILGGDDGETPIPASQEEWSARFGVMQFRRIRQSVINGVEISTVFLGIDHNFGVDGPPILFETMVFGGPMDQDTRRYATYREAVAGHLVMCALVEAALAFDTPSP